MFYIYLAVFEGWMLVMFLASWNIGLGIPSQARRPDYPITMAFTQHAGLVLDVLLISPMLAAVFARYASGWSPLPFFAWGAVGTIVTLFVLESWRQGSVGLAEPCGVDGMTRPAGVLHAIYTCIGLFAFLL